MIEDFYKTVVCKSEAHCTTCRSLDKEGNKFREFQSNKHSIGNVLFDCPREKEWGGDFETPEQTCKCRGEVLREPDPKLPCYGRLMECKNPEAPLDSQWENQCNKVNCNFFE